jgi:twitching motility protein PilT
MSLLKVFWTKCQDNVWADLYAVDLSHPHFDGLDGVFIVWHGGAKPGHVRVGFGSIRDGIVASRLDPAVAAYRGEQLFVTWAKTDAGLGEGATRYLAKLLAPKAQGAIAASAVPPVEVNLPNEPGAPEPRGNNPPTQTWQDLAADDGALPDSAKKAAAPPPPVSSEPKVVLRPMTDIVEILSHCAHYNASDVLLVPNEPPMIRHDGSLMKLPQAAALPAEHCKQTIYGMLNERQRAAFEEKGELDCSFSFKDTRFRVNVYVQQHGIAAALRVISPHIPEPEQIGLSPALMKLTDLTRGLVLVTGPTGSGKTTTLACMIELINKRRKKHIITIEDPIEFSFQNKSSIIDQREVGQHTASFAAALKYSLRQNPDVILIGEMRDQETVDLAIRAAETGHLCFSTLHTQDAPSTIDRIISEFPLDQRQKLCNVLANVLVGVVTQVLIPRRDGGRVCAREVMVMTPAIATLLRDDKVHQIRGAIEAGSHDGMQTLDQSIALLIQQKLIAPEEGFLWARHPHSLRDILENAVRRGAVKK